MVLVGLTVQILSVFNNIKTIITEKNPVVKLSKMNFLTQIFGFFFISSSYLLVVNQALSLEKDYFLSKNLIIFMILWLQCLTM
jgi:hypothetical protein